MTLLVVGLVLIVRLAPGITMAWRGPNSKAFSKEEKQLWSSLRSYQFERSLGTTTSCILLQRKMFLLERWRRAPRFEALTAEKRERWLHIHRALFKESSWRNCIVKTGQQMYSLQRFLKQENVTTVICLTSIDKYISKLPSRGYRC